MKMKPIALIFLVVTALGGCGAASSIAQRHATATEIAAKVGMAARVIPAGLFNLSTWARLNKPEAPADVYIEGDGLAWLNSHTISLNPTPPDPLTLRLATLDTADNVIYMARPCQYTGWNGGGYCPDKYWTNARTAPEIIASYQKALDHIKASGRISGFNLIGYSGGAAVAALVAAERTDVLSLRTVAGNLDYRTFSAIHNVSPADLSRDPVDVSSKLASLPQRHFIGAEDVIVPLAVFEGWKARAGSAACIHSAVVPDVTHEKGWVERWPALLSAPLSCSP